ncbi:hypothetical protein BDY19DRAFT_893965 [Irpex rosettiformis]|uniref:Uncharacterized protein n=1 Tax=Irpex rosettiformis TaxID=378272 RepID=A0ACB8TY57_9APHY|nr:hypothetical protein BDY19DRAFT_893965 [Irpex rosettiformis]
MVNTASKRVGPFAIWDFPLPEHVKDYTTLIILHGFAWHSGIFMRMIPFAEQQGCRLVLVNRRDYPGSLPYTDEELEPLRSAAQHDMESPEALAILLRYTKSRAQELYDFLCAFIQTEGLVEKSVVLVGWSFGSTWITQLLVHASSLSTGGLSLRKYIKRVVWYGSPAICMGYPTPPQSYVPLTHPSHPPGEGVKLFHTWVSGYYDHGDGSSEELEQRTPLVHPPPTISTMTTAEIDSAQCTAPGQPGGSDDLFLMSGMHQGLWENLRKRALLLSSTLPNAINDQGNAPSWDDMELHYVWCDQGAWQAPWVTLALKEELREAQQTGKEARKFQAHWDQPERTLTALLSTVPEL